jgi:hypothetical protein
MRPAFWPENIRLVAINLKLNLGWAFGFGFCFVILAYYSSLRFL